MPYQTMELGKTTIGRFTKEAVLTELANLPDSLRLPGAPQMTSRNNRIRFHAFILLIAAAAPSSAIYGGDSLADWLADKPQQSKEIPSSEAAPAPLAVESSYDNSAIHKGGTESEVVRERYPDATIKIEREVALDPQQNYVNHGRWTMWDRSGNTVAEGNYKMGKKHGLWKRTYADEEGKAFEGPLYDGFKRPFRAEIELEDGEPNGTWVVFDAQDRKMVCWEFVYGKRHGKSTWWYSNGAPLREVTFVDDQLDGELVDWDQKREIARKVQYVAGRELVKDMQWHNSDQKRHEGWVLQSRTIVNPTYDWWNGIVRLPLAKSVPDQRHGKWAYWHANGTRRADGDYFLGQRHGGWTWWYENGQVSAKGSYVDGNPDGRWGWWYSTGHRRSIGKYDGGEEVGVWSTWQEDGRLVQVLDYSAPQSVAQQEEEPKLEKLVVAETEAPIEEVPPPDLAAVRSSIRSSTLR